MGGNAEAETTPEATFEEFMAAKMHGAGIPGMAAAIVAGGEVKWQKGSGIADITSHRPKTTDTPFPIASISKTFIATALMQLVEAGVIDLGAPGYGNLRGDGRRHARFRRHPGMLDAQARRTIGDREGPRLIRPKPFRRDCSRARRV